ncbi:MAG TPA: TonB-dependent receptor [Spongiibacteraceae bacterium]|nr:TonB-dependent receptor [Spongiibacteraceae bacterium]MBN51927.1 TonB-dependent receptor [Spongiibacteraceae bacterium]HCS29061.1 TonB-dependent receptor [Spongiibacteraceae bacterium]
MKPKRLILVAACAASCSLVAQESGGGKENLALEEVVVTAQKKAESLQETPISLTAFGEEQLEKDGISNLNDIGSSVPSMTIEPFPINNATLRIFIRGVGLIDAQVTQDAPVGIYLDGAFIARSTGTALDVADLQRIEVLRGPQGTLYGRNSTGGTINLITKRPTADAFELKQTFKAGNFGLFSSKTSVNIPLTDSAAVKLAYLNTQKDGFVENTGPGGDFGDRAVEGWRIDATWDVNERLQADYSYDYSEIEYFNHTYQPVFRREPNAFDLTDPQGSINGQIQNSVQDLVTHSDKRWSRAATAAPLLESKVEIEGHAFTVFWDYSESLQIKYIGAYRELSDSAYTDLSGGGGTEDYRLDSNNYTTSDGSTSFGVGAPKQEQMQFSHEFQFSGALWDTRLDYLAGLYYFYEEADETRAFGHQFHAPVSQQEPLPGTVVNTTLINLVSNDFDIENEALAAFGRLTWTPAVLDDRLHLTFGARHSEDSRFASKAFRTANLLEVVTETPAGSVATPPVPLPENGYATSADQDFSDDSFELIAEFDVNDDVNVYVKSVEAYKSGGFNTRDPDQARFERGFDKEKVASLELGMKSEFLDRRLRVNADVFFSDYTDVQLNFLIAGSIADTQVVNAGEAEMKGAELDLTFLASRNLILSLSYAYLDASVTKATDPDTGADVTEDFVFSSAPMHSGTASMDYTLAEWSWARLGLNVSYNYLGDKKGSVRSDSVSNTFLEGYDLINARLGLYDMPFAGGSLTAAIWGKNLEDTEYVINAVDNLPQAARSVIWGDPRSYGLDLIYNY